MKRLVLTIAILLLATSVAWPATTIRATAKNTGLSAAPSVSAPTGTAVGDLVMVWVVIDGLRTVTDNNGSTPFTKDTQQQESTGTTTVALFTRRIITGDPTTYAFTSNVSDDWSVIAVALQSPHASVIYDVSPVAEIDSTADDTTLGTPDITTLNANSIHFVQGSPDSSTHTITALPSGYTQTDKSEGTGTRVIVVASKVIVAAGATGAQAFTVSANSFQIGISLAIRDVGTVAEDNFARRRIAQ